MGLFKPAVRQQIRLRAAIDGPTGAGKTYTALQLARIIAGPDGPVGIIDTESDSALRYAPEPGDPPDRQRFYDDPFDFGHLPARAPYDPRILARTIEDAAAELGPTGVLIVDSASHYWNGAGGTLEIVEDAEDRARGNRFAAWREGTPAQRMMLAAFLDCQCHIIVCMRSEMSYELQEKVVDGRTVKSVEKMGLKPVQRGGIEYEFDIVLSMDQAHTGRVTKSRIKAVADRVVQVGESHKLGEDLAAWLQTGVKRIDEASAKSIVAMFDTVEDETARKDVKRRFVDRFGVPADLLENQVEDVYAWLEEELAKLEPAQGTLDGTAEPSEAPAEPDEVAAGAMGDVAEADQHRAETSTETAQDGPESVATPPAPPEPPKGRQRRQRAQDSPEEEPQQVTGSLADAIRDDG